MCPLAAFQCPLQIRVHLPWVHWWTTRHVFLTKSFKHFQSTIGVFFFHPFILHGPVKLATSTRTNPLPMALCPPELERPPPPPPRFLFPFLCPSSAYVEPTQAWLFRWFSPCNNTITLYCRLHTRIPWGGPMDFTVSTGSHLWAPVAAFFRYCMSVLRVTETQSHSVSPTHLSVKVWAWQLLPMCLPFYFILLSQFSISVTPSWSLTSSHSIYRYRIIHLCSSHRRKTHE